MSMGNMDTFLLDDLNRQPTNCTTRFWAAPLIQRGPLLAATQPIRLGRAVTGVLLHILPGPNQPLICLESQPSTLCFYTGDLEKIAKLPVPFWLPPAGIQTHRRAAFHGAFRCDLSPVQRTPQGKKQLRLRANSTSPRST